MTQTIINPLKKLAIISAISVSLLLPSQVKADHDRDLLLLAAPFLFYSLIQDHSYPSYTRIQRHHRGHHKHKHHRQHKHRKHSHSRGHYSNDRRRHHRRH